MHCLAELRTALASKEAENSMLQTKLDTALAQNEALKAQLSEQTQDTKFIFTCYFSSEERAALIRKNQELQRRIEGLQQELVQIARQKLVSLV